MIKNVGNDGSDDLSIKPNELKKKIDQGEDIFILDVRNSEEHKSWKISYDRYPDSQLIPIDELPSRESLKKIPKDKEIITFCARGNRSMSAAKILSKYGYKVKSIEGGLNGWNAVYDLSLITQKNSPINIWQIRRISKGCISYLISNSLTKDALVIDATCEIDSIISNILNENNFKLTKVVETHLHADHLSGATKLAKKYGSTIYLSSLENYNIKNNEYGLKFKFIRDRDTIKIGNEVFLEAVYTPGHTSGSISFKLEITTDNFLQKSRNEDNQINNSLNKMFVFVGDTLFINGVGRPDLHGKTDEFAHKLFNTYQQKVLILPDEAIILPSHHSGIFEHKKPIYDTIKSIKQKINLLSASENDFVKYINKNIPPHPMNHDTIISINKQLIACDKIEQNDIEMGPNACGIVK
jgi:glyoxylase-like metal-dependent hydrolase (beta-lactamase superfamily II)/rhodanese-related sulfurtransferase